MAYRQAPLKTTTPQTSTATGNPSQAIQVSNGHGSGAPVSSAAGTNAIRVAGTTKVKTAGVDDSILVFEGPAHVVESQDEAVENILADKVKAGDVVVVRYEGPKGGPGMQEMLYPTSYIKSKGLGKACALLTDGRFSGGTSGLSIGHCSPEAAAGGAIGLVRNGDRIRIDIPNRTINVLLSDEELAQRRAEQDAKGWKPALPRPRKVSTALKAYAKLVTSADKGAVRDASLLD